ncbi:ribosome maturation factor RimM [Sporolactobacillus sp. THM19-2]|uniref:ribosome maturation factor RimM n=1 Tax=Sporolactobacillus sp. THM19-2 TaxID=2511171 RepID=UPI00101F3AB0|nr:ribosome maturation factor RimM [Sporolactobacillus sp. THM19-2]RYL92930.1 ribosome maturation factor RimM [Sporolactobacillus sp. THM19-2]
MTHWQYVGKIVNTRGIKGEVKVISVTDFPDERFATGALLYVHDEKNSTYHPLTVTGFTRRKTFDCLTFKDYDSINAVEKYKGCSLYVPREQLSELEEGSYYYYQIIGAQVMTDTGTRLGRIKEILSPGANDVWVVETEGKDLLIPYIKDVVKAVDTEKKQVTIHLIPGLIDHED